MNYINPPANAPANFFHRTMYSRVLEHEIGYSIYLPPEYETDNARFPVVYHLHGWTGSESTEIHAMEPVCRSRRCITVFPNSSPVIEDRENLPVEEFIVQDLIPFIDREYRTLASREHRGISGFSMGGGAAFFYGVKHFGLFEGVTAYAGTYHHYYGRIGTTVGADPAEAAPLRELIRQSEEETDRNVLLLLDKQAHRLRDSFRIELRVGADDVLLCDNEILHMHLNALGIDHKYIKITGADHSLPKII